MSRQYSVSNIKSAYYLTNGVEVERYQKYGDTWIKLSFDFYHNLMSEEKELWFKLTELERID